MRSRRLVVPVALLAGAAALLPVTAGAGGRPLTAALTGAAERPGPGDWDGSGFVHVTLNQGRGEVCIDYTVENVDLIRAAHIHKAPPTSPGPVVVGLPGGQPGCVQADPALIKAIRQNPGDYYFNAHNTTFPGGAVRGQLSK